MSEYLITARDGACRAGLSIQALRVVRLFSASNLTQGCQKIAVATWAFYHRLESKTSSTEILCAASRATLRCLMVHTVGKNIAQPGTDQSQTMFLGRRRGMALTIPLTGRDGR